MELADWARVHVSKGHGRGLTPDVATQDPSAPPVERLFIERLSPRRTALLEEVLQRPPPSCLSHARRELQIARQADDRLRQRPRLSRRHQQARDAVLDELPEAPDLGRD